VKNIEDSDMTACDFGFIGLGVMGQNLALNVESKSYRVAIYDQLPAVIKDF
jgi:6-phosphogluconate dehydrogenase